MKTPQDWAEYATNHLTEPEARAFWEGVALTVDGLIYLIDGLCHPQCAYARMMDGPCTCPCEGRFHGAARSRPEEDIWTLVGIAQSDAVRRARRTAATQVEKHLILGEN